MKTEEDCQYYKQGMCYLTEMENCDKVGNGLDEVHRCEMCVPCFDKKKK